MPTGRRRVGLVAVHGIGRQKRGVTAERIACAFAERFSRTTISYEAKARVLVVKTDDVELRIYEAYWADILDGEAVAGTFRSSRLGAIAWMPIVLRAPARDRRIAIALALLFLLSSPLLAVVGFFRILFDRCQRALDEVPADVVNYCDSAINSPRCPRHCRRAAGQITARVLTQLRQSAADGCDQTYVFGHSLGSVIAVRTLLRADLDAARVGGLITTGSPLRHLLRAYPELVDSEAWRCLGLSWHNFFDPLDLIARPTPLALRTATTIDHQSYGWAGAFSSHFAYERSSSFLREVGSLIFGASPRRSGRLMFWRWLGVVVAAGRDALFLAALVFSYAIGFVGSCAFLVAFVESGGQDPSTQLPTDPVLDYHVLIAPQLVMWATILLSIVVGMFGVAYAGASAFRAVGARKAYSNVAHARPLARLAARESRLLASLDLTLQQRSLAFVVMRHLIAPAAVVLLVLGLIFLTVDGMWAEFYPPAPVQIAPTALCNDDHYSFEFVRDPCMHHKGVHWWLLPPWSKP
jgi:pimeloyl-ACP methyl ester carboxylesterase